MKSKTVRMYGDDSAIEQYSQEPGVSITVVALNINEAAAIKVLVNRLRAELAEGRSTHLMTVAEAEALDNKLKKYVSYEPLN